jgi:hypothetical protein
MTADEIAKCIPDEVVEAAARMRYERHIAQFPDIVFPTWDNVSPNVKASRKEDEQAIFAAGLAAWPGADTDVNEDPFGAWEEKFLILPLQETP